MLPAMQQAKQSNDDHGEQLYQWAEMPSMAILMKPVFLKQHPSSR